MKCPLSFDWIDYGKEDRGFADYACLGEDCAWWSPLSDCCAVRDLPGIFIAIGNVLGKIHVELCLSRYTYTCKNCSTRIEKTASGEFKEPTGWIHEEGVDGKFAWICDRCSAERR